jgi:hypothetical protein
LALAARHRRCPDAIVDAVQRYDSTGMAEHRHLVRKPVRAVAMEALHLRDVAVEGVSPATPAILVGAVVVIVVPLAACIIARAFVVAALS